MTEDWFIKRYSSLHQEINKLENEIEYHLLNKNDLIENNNILEDLKKRSFDLIKLLNETRENERRIFNYKNC